MSSEASIDRRAVWVVLVGAAAVFGLNAGGRVYESRDVVRYAEMVLEMRHAGSLVPTLNGVVYTGATPLAAWAPYLGSYLLGELSPLSVRLVSALAAWATVLVVWRLARRAAPRAALIAAAAAAANYLAWTYGRSSRIESVLALATVGTLAAFFAAGRARGARRPLGFAVAGVALGLGIAAKGPYALAIIGAALGPYLLFERRWRDLFEGGAIAGSVAAVISAGWLLFYVHLLGPVESRAFFDQFLLRETLDKFETGYGKAAPVWAYVVEVIPKLAPWSVVGLVGAARVLRRPSAATALERLATSWAFFPFVLLSASSGKHIRYAIPMVPAWAILAGFELDRWLASPAVWVRRALALSTAVLGAALAAAGLAAGAVYVVRDGISGYAILSSLAAFGGGAAAFALAWRRRVAPGLLGLYVAIAGVVCFVYAAYLPLPAAAASTSEVWGLARRIEPALEPGESLAILAPPAGEEPDPDPSQLGLHLGNRWIEQLPRGAPPGPDLLLAPAPQPGYRVRAAIDWPRGRERVPERWYLLEPEMPKAR